MHAVTAHGRTRIDAVVVPAGPDRRPRSVALDLAAQLGAPLLVLCHPSIDLDEVEAETRSAGVRGYAVTVERPAAVPLPDSLVTVLPPSQKQVSIATARNLGLLVGRLAGWRCVVWLDDDVHDVDASAVRGASQRIRLGGFGCVGWSSTWFPDNSVVCHANRLAGNRQSSFISTGLLVMAVDPCTPHFPVTYNEDWLYCFDLLRHGRVGYGGRVLQLPYDPFATPERACEEEFGDLLAEGLFHLLHEVREGRIDGQQLGSTIRSEGYWAREIEFRGRFLASIAERLQSGAYPSATPDAQVARSLASVAAAGTRLADIRSAHVVEVVDAWRDDARTWASILSSLYPLGSVLAAFDRLHITDHRPRTD